jgi:hypothetical protein
MKKIYLILVVAICYTASLVAQQEVTVFKVDNPPVMDGIADEVAIWGNLDMAPIQAMELNIGNELENNVCSWQAVHDGEYIYVLLSVEDDINLLEDPTGLDEDNWHFDRVELFFDMRTDSDDGAGPGDPGPNDPGNSTFRYKAIAKVDQGPVYGQYVALSFTDANYLAEWKIPFSELEEAAGDEVLADGLQNIGFDVVVIDRDIMAIPYGRKVWENDDPIEENWQNMDGAGHIILSAELAPTSVMPKTAARSIQVYPNPVKNELNVKSENLDEVAIISVTGQEVMRVKVIGDNVKLDISNITGGVYFVRATDISGTTSTYKFVKQ